MTISNDSRKHFFLFKTLDFSVAVKMQKLNFKYHFCLFCSWQVKFLKFIWIKKLYFADGLERETENIVKCVRVSECACVWVCERERERESESYFCFIISFFLMQNSIKNDLGCRKNEKSSKAETLTKKFELSSLLWELVRKSRSKNDRVLQIICDFDLGKDL